MVLRSDYFNSVTFPKMSTLHPTYKSQHYIEKNSLYFSTYCELVSLIFIGWIKFFNIVLGLFDDNFVRQSIQAINNRDRVFLFIFNPPWLKPQWLNFIYGHTIMLVNWIELLYNFTFLNEGVIQCIDQVFVELATDNLVRCLVFLWLSGILVFHAFLGLVHLNYFI